MMEQSVEAMEASVRGIHDLVAERNRLREQLSERDAENARLADELETLRLAHERLVAHASLLDLAIAQARTDLHHLQAERDVAREKQTALCAQASAAVAVLCDGIDKANQLHAPHGAVARLDDNDGKPVPLFLLQPLSNDNGGNHG
jgi:chromosome segregation ATPase